MKREPIPTGTRFGRLVVVDYTTIGGRYACVCKCDCGAVATVRDFDLKLGRQVSCGCYNSELRVRPKKHGLCYERLFRIWCNMKERCTKRGTRHTKNYGDRGISVCREWVDNYEVFRKWALNNGYNDDLTIERIDVNGNYCPSNCKFITLSEQSKNKQNTIVVDGICLKDWCKKHGLNYSTVHSRIRNGMSVEDSISKQIRSRIHK